MQQTSALTEAGKRLVGIQLQCKRGVSDIRRLRQQDVNETDDGERESAQPDAWPKAAVPGSNVAKMHDDCQDDVPS